MLLMNKTRILLRASHRQMVPGERGREMTWANYHKKASRNVNIKVVGIGEGEKEEQGEQGGDDEITVKGSTTLEKAKVTSWDQARAAKLHGDSETEIDKPYQFHENTTEHTVSITPFKAAGLNGVDESLCEANKPMAVIQTSSSDISVKEILTKTKQPCGSILSITFSTERLTTSAAVMILADELRQPVSAFKPYFSNIDTHTHITQTVLFTATDASSLQHVTGKLSQFIENNEVFTNISTVPRSLEDVLHKGASNSPWGWGGNASTSAPCTTGLLTITSATTFHNVMEISGFETTIIVRDVYDTEILQNNVGMVAEEGFLNLKPIPLGKSRHALDWVEVGTCALNGDYKSACSRLLQAVAKSSPEFQEIVVYLVKYVSRARTNVDAWYLRRESQEDVVVDGDKVTAKLRRLPPHLRWAGELLHTILVSTAMARHRTAWHSIPIATRSWIEEAPSTFLWNRMAVERLTRYGVDPIVGDVVRTPLGAVKVIKSDSERGMYTRHDVLLPYPQLSKGPQWSKDVVFPTHRVSQTAYEIMMKQFGMTPDRLHPNEMRTNEGWTPYRNFTSKPKNVSVEVHQGGIDGDAPVMATEVACRAAVYLKKKGKKKKKKVQPPQHRVAYQPDPEVLLTCLVHGKVFTRHQWAKLLTGMPAAPLPPPGPYAEIKECDSCGLVNHTSAGECENCLGTTFTSIVKPPEDTAHTFKITSTLPKDAALESFLNEMVSMHCWSGYEDPVSVKVSEELNLLNFI
eukprot:TRINITY_DN462_c4_g1_i1.p1 TRINITY_DN462_c4_g1~~TRINITY_DN462_c4_g1_i1.p1  ORF type:complete len:768 (+),score=145.91 TRINITY_DN462_c4_g1_i1:64-2304(+)